MKRAAILSILLLIETGIVAPLLLYNYLKTIDTFSEEEDAGADDEGEEYEAKKNSNHLITNALILCCCCITIVAVALRSTVCGGDHSREALRNQVHQHSPSCVTSSIPRLLAIIFAGLLMHGPGLKVKFKYEDWDRYCHSLLGAGVEGIFILFFGSIAFHAGHCVYGHLSDHSKLIGRIRTKLCVGFGSLLAMWSFGFIVFSVYGDTTFRLMSGNDDPLLETLMAGFEGGLESTKAFAMAQLHSEPLSAIWRLAFGASCAAMSIYIYIYPLRKQWRMMTKSEPKRTTAEGGGVDDDMVAAAAYDIENKAFIYTVEKTSSSHCKGTFPKSKVLQIYILCSLFGYLACLMNSRDWYTPILFAFTAYVSVIFDIENSDVEEATGISSMERDLTNNPPVQPGAPNIIYIQHDSLSGSLMFNTENGAKAMPFFQSLMKDNTDFYAFEHMHTGSGNTLDAMPALMTGCLPYTKEGLKWVSAEGRTIGHDFKERGYKTASLSSVVLKENPGTLSDLLAGVKKKHFNNTIYDLVSLTQLFVSCVVFKN